MTKEWMEEQYLVKHLSREQIGKMIGCSGRWIGKLVTRYGLNVHSAEWADVQCCVCGKAKKITRSHWKRTQQSYCSRKCYYDRMGIVSNYKKFPYGCRIARQVLVEKLGRELEKDECVHHKDGNQKNNRIDNLMLFANQSAHMKHHHELRMFR